MTIGTEAINEVEINGEAASTQYLEEATNLAFYAGSLSELRKPDLIHIPDDFDTVMQKQYLREYAESRFPNLNLIRIDREETVVDDLYHETTTRRFQTPITVKAFVQHEPSKKLLIKYGLEQKRQILVMVTTVHLDDLNILENRDDFLIGDLIKWGDEVYEILDQTKDTEGYWANTNIPFYLVLGCDYYRQGS